jgi:hypothetical protein
VVEIEEEHGHEIGTALVARECVLDAITEQSTVAKPSERITQHLIEESGFHCLPLGYVAAIEHNGADTRLVAQVRCDAIDPPPAAVRVP